FGIRFLPNGFSHLAVVNTIVADNSNEGVRIQPTGGGSVTATLSRVQLINNFDGLGMFAGVNGSTATITAVVEDSIAARNNNVGFGVTTAVPQASLMVIRSVAAHGGAGVLANGANAILQIGQSTL